VKEKRNVSKFNEDILSVGGYHYTAVDKVSSRFANDRMTKLTIDTVDLSNKTVIDIGCGDGSYSHSLLQENPEYILGIDAAQSAIVYASEKFKNQEKLLFRKVNVYDLDTLDNIFDIAVVRGVLHHLPDAKSAITQIVKSARVVVVIEPNGYNPILKIIEKLSKYHREHEEKSYSPKNIDKWFLGVGDIEIVQRRYIGFVPFFCPDMLAIILKKVEPFIEAVPFLRNICCAQYTLKIVSVSNR